MKDRLKVMGIVMICLLAIFSYVYVNFIMPGTIDAATETLQSELTEIKISKFFIETLRRVQF